MFLCPEEIPRSVRICSRNYELFCQIFEGEFRFIFVMNLQSYVFWDMDGIAAIDEREDSL
jgi:hypothetical protein